MTAADPVVVVGAGLAGLTAARHLADAGVPVVVLDKARAPGGRMASRSIGPARFDQGAQHLAARAPAFRALVDTWLADGVAQDWFSTPGADGTVTRYVGVGGMRALPTHLAAGLDVRTGVAVTSVAVDGDGVVVALADGTEIAGRAAVLTAPLPQSLDLLRAGSVAVDDVTRSTLDAVDYEPCLAVMAELDGPSGLADGHRRPPSGPVAWIGDNQHKGVSAVPAVTIHSTAEYAAARLEDDPDTWVEALVAAAAPHLAGAVVAATGHRWRYAQPATTLDLGSLRLPDAPIVLAGDAFTQPRVEGAFLSGLDAARSLLAGRTDRVLDGRRARGTGAS